MAFDCLPSPVETHFNFLSLCRSLGFIYRNSETLALQVEGTLSVQPQANPVVGFEKHFLSLTVENNQRNPWFVGESEEESKDDFR